MRELTRFNVSSPDPSNLNQQTKMTLHTFVTPFIHTQLSNTREKITSIKQPRKLSQRTRSNVVSHLRRRPQPAVVPNSGMGSRPEFMESVRHSDVKIFTLTWDPIQAAKSGMIIIPSLIWHSAWFWELGLALSKEGVRVVALDPPGCGRSGYIKGKRYYIDSMDDILDDLEASINRMVDTLPTDAPITVLAESAGAIPMCMLAMRPSMMKKVNGWIMCGPAIKVNEKIMPSNTMMFIMKTLSRFFPNLPLKGDDFDGDTFDQAFGDGRSAEIAKKDPYVSYQVPIPIRTACAIFGAMDLIQEKLDDGEMKMNKVLVLHNKKDMRTVYKASEEFVTKVITNDGAQLMDMEGNHHQLFQEERHVTKATIKRIMEFVNEL